MTRFDLVVRGGLVALPGEVRRLDIGVKGGRIAALIEHGSGAEAEQVIEADGRLVMPGMVDVHVHTRDPGYTHKEDIETASAAAAAGGVTTIFAMPNVSPAPTNPVLLDEMLDRYGSLSHVDFNVNPAPTDLDQVDELASMGVCAFKIYMVVDTGRDYPHPAGVGVHDHGRLLAMMEAIAPTGLPLMVHPHDQQIMDHLERRHWEAGDRSPEAYAQTLAAYDGLIWDTAVALLLRLAEATGCPIHIVHAQTPRTLAMIAEARSRGVRVTCEVNHWALFLGTWEDVKTLGPYALSYHVPERFQTRLWEGLSDGTVDILSSDHAPHTREEKEVGWTDMWAAHSGTPGVDFQVPLLLDAVSNGRIELTRAVELMSSSPADIFGLGHKGRLVPGADADIVVADLDEEWTITDDDAFTKVGWTPYRGRTIKGRVKQTLVRGREVFRDGEIVGEPGWGVHAAYNGGVRT